MDVFDDDLFGEDFGQDSYMEQVQSSRHSLRQKLGEVKDGLRKQRAKLEEIRVDSDRNIRESVDRSMQQLDEARRQVKRAIQEIDRENRFI